MVDDAARPELGDRQEAGPRTGTRRAPCVRAGRDERRQRQPREVVAGQEALAGEVAVAVEVATGARSARRRSAARAAPRPRARSRFGLVLVAGDSRVRRAMIVVLRVALGRAPRGTGRASGRRPRRTAAARLVEHARRASRRSHQSASLRARRRASSRTARRAARRARRACVARRVASRTESRSSSVGSVAVDVEDVASATCPRLGPVSASQIAWTWARTRSSLARSSRGGATAPATISSRPAEEVLVVRAASVEQ